MLHPEYIKTLASFMCATPQGAQHVIRQLAQPSITHLREVLMAIRDGMQRNDCTSSFAQFKQRIDSDAFNEKEQHILYQSLIAGKNAASIAAELDIRVEEVHKNLRKTFDLLRFVQQNAGKQAC